MGFAQDRKPSIIFWAPCMLVAALLLAYPFFSLECLDRWDLPFHLNRVEGIKEGLLAGEFPVRIHAFQMNGYGTADGVMYPDLLLYFPALLRLAGLPLALSYNIYWIFLVLFSMAMAWRGYTVWTGSMRSGALAAMLHCSTYLYAANIGAMPGDYPAICSLPLALGALHAMLRKPGGSRHWPEFVVAFTASAQSHVITTLLMAVAAVALCLRYPGACLERRGALGKAALFAVLLNAWRFVPFLYFYETIRFHINHPPLYASLQQITDGWADIAKSQFFLGWPILLLAACFLRGRRARACPGYLFACGACAFLVCMTWQGFPWEAIERAGAGFLVNFQMAHRFLPLGSVVLCRYLGCFLADAWAARGNACPAAIGLACCAAGIWSGTHIPYYVGHGPVSDNMAKYRAVEPLPSYGPEVQEDYLYSDVVFADLRNRKGEIPGPMDFISDARIFDARKQGTRIRFSYEAADVAAVQLPLFFWPGYEARDAGGKSLETRSGEHRFLEVLLPPGKGSVHVHYAGPWFFRLFDGVSLLALPVFLLLWKKERGGKENGCFLLLAVLI